MSAYKPSLQERNLNKSWILIIHLASFKLVLVFEIQVEGSSNDHYNENSWNCICLCILTSWVMFSLITFSWITWILLLKLNHCLINNVDSAFLLLLGLVFIILFTDLTWSILLAESSQVFLLDGGCVFTLDGEAGCPLYLFSSAFRKMAAQTSNLRKIEGLLKLLVIYVWWLIYIPNGAFESRCTYIIIYLMKMTHTTFWYLILIFGVLRLHSCNFSKCIHAWI